MSTDRSTVKAEVVACARGLYDVTFVPHEAVTHYVNISFNEEDVPGAHIRVQPSMLIKIELLRVNVYFLNCR